MDELHDLFIQKPYLAWYVDDKKKLSKTSMLEHILNFGSWDDYLVAERVFGIEGAHEIFNKIKNKKRVNLRPQTVNYFEKYYDKHA